MLRESKEPCACGAPKSQVAKCCFACRKQRVVEMCVICDALFTRKKSQKHKTCGGKCRDILRGRNYAASHPRVRVERICDHCGAKKLDFPSNASRRFCSKDCRDAHFVGENSPSWKGGITHEHQTFFGSKEWAEQQVSEMEKAAIEHFENMQEQAGFV